MEAQWSALVKILQQMNDGCDHMIDLAKRQRSALTEERIRDLGQIVIEQEETAARFASLENERDRLTGEIGNALGIRSQDRTSVMLGTWVPVQVSGDFRRLVEGLQNGLRTVKQEHEINRKILTHAQDFSSWLMKYLVTPDGAAPMYDAGGREVQRSYQHFVNHAW